MAPAEKGGGRRGSKSNTESRSGSIGQPDSTGTDQSASLTSVEGSGAGQDPFATDQAGYDRAGLYGVEGSGGNEAFGGTGTAGSTESSGAGTGDDQAGRAGSVASGVKQFVRNTAYEQLGSQKQRATEGLGTIAQAVRQSTQQLRDSGQPKAAEYVDRAAGQLEQFSSSLRDRDLQELLDEVTRFARRQPAVFIGTAFGLGLLAARFLKSSSQGRGSRYGQGGRRQLQSSWSRGSDQESQGDTESGSSWSSASRSSGSRQSGQSTSSEPPAQLPGSESGV